MTATPRPRLLLVLSALSLAAGGAAAETRLVSGNRLVLNSTQSATVVIATDATLSDSVRLSAEGSLSCVSAMGGQAAEISTGGCEDQLGSLRIEVSPAMPVTVTANGDETIQIGNLRGPLKVTLNGSADLKAGRSEGLALSLNGSGDAAVGAVNGPASLDVMGGGDVRLGSLSGRLSIRHAGSGDLDVGTIEAPAADIESTGSGDMLIGGGTIGTLHARLYGSGDMAVAATVSGGDVSASGGADVKLARVTGALNRSANGGSTIVVGGSAIVTDIMAQVARGIGEANLPGGRGAVVVHAPSMVGHLVTVALVAVMLFFVWRIVRRSGGVAALTRRGASRPTDQPTHPGVLALGETMTRLDQRLGRIEGYVTTREFDLNRKFRDLR